MTPRITAESLYRLLPAVHRLRDADQGEPLRALVAVLAREGAVLEENIEQLLDDLFIETCADWAAPYVGGIIGYRPLHQVEGLPSPRAEVANTIAYRRRKGTAAVLEQLAMDVTGWPARAVEYFALVATCQHSKLTRPDHHFAPSLRDPLPLEDLGHAFDRVTRTVDVRSIAQHPSAKGSGGRHNLPNIGLFLWRLKPQPYTNAPTTQVDGRRYLFDVLGAPRQLVNRPQAETTITRLAQPVNVPGAISRRALYRNLTLFYGRDDAGVLRSFEITVDGVAIPPTRVRACDLSDVPGGWYHSPHAAIDPAELAVIEGASDPEVPPPNALVRVDPVLGRIAFPEPEDGEVRVSFHTAFPADLGGGEYDRARSLSQLRTGEQLIAFPHPDHADLQSALTAIAATGGIVEIETNDAFDAPATIRADAGMGVELRAADGVRPVIRAAGEIVVSGGAEARIRIDGLVIEGGPVRIAEEAGVSLGEVTISHATLIPGHGFTGAGEPAQPGAASLVVETTGVELTLERVISGALQMTDTTNVTIRDSIVDFAALDPADSAAGLAIGGLADGEPAGALTILASTIVGRILARSFPLVSDSILNAHPPALGGPPVRAMRRQEGCMRFSFVPDGSIVPRRYRCQPQLAIDRAVAEREAETGTQVSATDQAEIAERIARALVPAFTSLSASAPAYLQLGRTAPAAIRTGASDESEMGVYHHLFQPQRESNLRIRLDEYLRFGLEAGLFYET